MQKDRKQFDIREEYFVSAQVVYMAFLRPFIPLEETQLGRGAGLGTEAHTASKWCPRMGRPSRGTPTEEAVKSPPSALLPIPPFVPRPPFYNIILL